MPGLTSEEARDRFSPFFDQEPPDVPVVRMIADNDISASYELDAAAVFACERGFLVVSVSGCSCWPDRGGTAQQFCEDRIAVQRYLTSDGDAHGSALLAACEANRWGVERPD